MCKEGKVALLLGKGVIAVGKGCDCCWERV